VRIEAFCRVPVSPEVSGKGYMPSRTSYLMSDQARARWMRVDTVQVLKRLFFCERALLSSMAAWLPLFPSMDIKTELPLFIWQNAQTADALRERVFELRFPSRVMEEEGSEAGLVALFAAVKDAPSVLAFLLSVGKVLLPALRDAFRAYLEVSDPIADGPTHRFLSLSLGEKEEQVRTVNEWAEAVLAEAPESRQAAVEWQKAVAEQLSTLGGVGLGRPSSIKEPGRLSGSQPYTIPDRPARDSRFWLCRFYWPDIVDPSFPYGEGTALQLRSAISHVNEVWAIETGGVILSAFAQVLPWEWIRDAARWTYDEARHCRMGYERLLAWGLDPAEIPLGAYIYESAAGEDPIYRLGMLFFFETKNIRHKPERARLFHTYGDRASEHDMDFDWADETIHAGFGKHWLKQLLSQRGQDPSAYEAIRERCREMIETLVNTATAREVTAIKEVAGALLAKACRE
jgi:uncharacterized ferritin-like protein (DUF455 family)